MPTSKMSASKGPHVVVVGGGIGGVAAARAVRVARPDATVTVLEASDRLGGKLARTDLAGTTIDVGAESILNRRPEGVDLARVVGLGDRLVHPEPASAALWSRDAIRPMPPTVMGVPSDLDALARSGLLSRAGLLRARADVPRRMPEGDVSVAAFIRARLGAEIVDRLVEPLLGGVYAGHASRLSLRAAAPQIAALAASGRRICQAARSSRAQTTDAPVFAGLDGGVGQLPDAVASASGAIIRTGVTVRELRRTSDVRWALVVGPTIDEELVEADAVIVAVPGAPASRLLASVSPVAARGLREIEYASMAIVSIAVHRDALPDGIDGSGFLVPPVDGRAIKAATYSSNKWRWVADAAGEVVIVRASIGRAGEEELLQRDDSELVALAVDDLRDAIGLHGPLVDAHVQRWGGALPQYAVGHLDTIDTIERAVDAMPGLAVCGAAYHGVGIPAVIATAQAAASRIVDHLSEASHARGTLEA